ncbi:hypothetical protein T439DRAFT_326100 [Meredithblackwellia eburnea MCA 4105]
MATRRASYSSNYETTVEDFLLQNSDPSAPLQSRQSFSTVVNVPSRNAAGSPLGIVGEKALKINPFANILNRVAGSGYESVPQPGEWRDPQNRQGGQPRWKINWPKAICLLLPVVAFFLFLTIFSIPLRLRAFFTARSQLVCPHPFLPRPSLPLSDSSLQTPPQNLNSFDDKFHLSISPSTTTCNSFRITITTKDQGICDEFSHASRPSSGEEDAGEFVKSLGPQTFRITIEGAERLVRETPTRFWPGRCEYEFDFAVNNPGPVWLDVDYLYEQPSSTRPSSGPSSPLLPIPLQLDLCKSQCTQYFPAINGHPQSLFSTSPNNPPTTDDLPSCTGPRPIKGSYISPAIPSLSQSTTTSSSSHSSHTLPHPFTPTFVPSTCQFSHDGLLHRSHKTCLETSPPHRVLFLGDGRMADLFDLIKWRLDGKVGEPMTMTGMEKGNKAIMAGPNVHLRYVVDKSLDAKFNCDFMADFDTIAVSSPGRSSCPSPTSYLRHLSPVLTSWPRLMKACPGRHNPTKFIFLTTPPSSSVDAAKCRTREHANEVAVKKALEEGWSVVDVWGLVSPVARHVGGSDSLLKSDAKDPIVDEFLEKMGICGDESFV